MIMLSLYTQGKIPFKHVYLHGLVKAPDGQKMSKSKGNVIQPEEIINKYGADSLRLMYIVGNKAGAGYPVSYEKLEGYKRFLNKIWNASKLVLSNLDENGEKLNNINIKELAFTKEDNEMRERLNALTQETTKKLDGFMLGLASQELYDSFWHDFCDIYLENVKSRLYTKDREGKPINTSEEAQQSRLSAQWMIYHTLKTYLKLLHPFVPFITETIWQELLCMQSGRNRANF
jgi:valyl-tRNA synthetase